MLQNCSITICQIPIRVRYPEVDRQNAVHHSVYPVYFEMGRTELLRANGYDYKTLEDNGIALVVARLECRFRAPARYDDELLLTTRVGKIDRVRLEHLYKLERPDNGRLIAEGRTILVHIDKEGKLQSLPEFLLAEKPE
ncbi:MAG: acyl-CoA thioesterase [Sedimentisphaerales bacterium]|nr:acyl-CoA thioesterase [Sedimentisphaerales bacterium]